MDIAIECFCGELKGSIKNLSPKLGLHIHCLCTDCQKFAKILKNEERILDSYGGSDIFQMTPADIKIISGEDKLSCLKLSEQGGYRWYTSCCQAPIANTMNSAKMPFAGVSTKIMKFDNDEQKNKTLGPVVMKAFGRSSIGEKPKDACDKFSVSGILKMMGFLGKGLLKGKSKPSPFFKDGKAIVPVELIKG